MEERKVRYIVTQKGERTAVVLAVEEDEALLEDLHDLAVMAQRRDEPTISFEEGKSKLNADGLR
jgi:hypothetical protein